MRRADIPGGLRDVRYSPKNGHRLSAFGCPPISDMALHSITSSAALSNVGGKLKHAL
jgi:hypothetical protein